MNTTTRILTLLFPLNQGVLILTILMATGFPKFFTFPLAIVSTCMSYYVLGCLQASTLAEEANERNSI